MFLLSEWRSCVQVTLNSLGNWSLRSLFSKSMEILNTNEFPCPNVHRFWQRCWPQQAQKSILSIFTNSNPSKSHATTNNIKSIIQCQNIYCIKMEKSMWTLDTWKRSKPKKHKHHSKNVLLGLLTVVLNFLTIWRILDLILD